MQQEIQSELNDRDLVSVIGNTWIWPVSLREDGKWVVLNLQNEAELIRLVVTVTGNHNWNSALRIKDLEDVLDCVVLESGEPINTIFLGKKKSGVDFSVILLDGRLYLTYTTSLR